MRAKLLVLFMVVSTSMTFAQDTTWVQTFTFDSISTRRGDFTFPQELNSKRFEKVLMYYKLKCSPLTPWDQYNCGEWDYLAYTRIFDHTGEMDSVQRDSVQFLNNYQNSSVYNYDLYDGSKFDQYVRVEQERSPGSTISYLIGGAGTAASNFPFVTSEKGSRQQFIITAAELISAGVVPGDIQSFDLFVSAASFMGDLWHPTISIKPTTDTDISVFHTTGFTEVYNRTKSALNGNALTVGPNYFLFHTPFAWNGTDNLVIDFSFAHSIDAGSPMLFESQQTGGSITAGYEGRNGVMDFDGTNHALLELSDVDLGDDITITFWAKGLGNSGVNTSILEGYDTLNNRILNIHFPWSNNRMYWDVGEGNGYDRIDKAATPGEIDNEWHHWAFVKNYATGELKMFKDGVLWNSGTGFTRSIGDLHRLVIGGNLSLANHWKGKMDELHIFDVAVDDATIATWYNQWVMPAHPNYSNLLASYRFDNDTWAQDEVNGNLMMPSEAGMIDFTEYPVAGLIYSTDRPLLAFGQGTVASAAVDIEEPFFQVKEPEVVFEFAPVDHHFEIVNAFLAQADASEDVYDVSNTVIASVPYTGSETYSNSTITYYQAPYEIVHDVEIGRFITPYGIQFDLGANGFEWIYDVTDYLMYLKDVVDLAAHNTQELIDLRFAFIEGIPPRDVHARQPIWSDWKSYSYSNLDNDVNLVSTPVALSDTSSMFKIKTRFTGHGHNGTTTNCCEWDSKDHMIKVDGVNRFTWEIWEETACGDNPNISQGGTWPYAREGWCPGDLVKEYDHDLTPWVTPGTTVQLDYDIEDIPSNDPAQGAGNYVAALDLISYSAPNFQNDAAIIDILNPNKWEYYGKWNPSCQNPRVILQNTGAEDLTSCTIKIWVSYGNFIEYAWTGSLGFLDKEVVEIPITDPGAFWTATNGTQTFTAQVWNIENNPALDEYEHNNVKSVEFESPESVFGPFYVQFQTNNKAFENQWRLEDSDGNIIFEQTSLANSTLYRDTFDLAPGCYSIILEDSDNDGIGFWYSAQVEGETTGTFRLRLVGGTWIEFFPADFGNFHRYNFSVGFTVNTEEQQLDHEIVIFPNPNRGAFDIELSGYVGNEAELQIYDLMGRVVLTEKMNAQSNFASSKVELLDAPAGHYIVKIVTKTGVYTEEFVIQ